MASTSHLAGLVVVFALALAAGCSKKGEPPAGEPSARARTVYTVNYPLAYFAERLAPDSVEVHFPVPSDVDPAFWKPSADAIAQYQSAGVILLNGAGYTSWTRYATLPGSRTVITAQGCREAILPSGEALKHQHGPEGEHAHGDTAFTTWLDLDVARCQARQVRDALVDLSPDDRQAIEARFADLDADLASVHEALEAAANAWGAKPLLASHPVYQYLSDRYSLRIESLHLEPDQPLGPDELRALDASRNAHPATVMLWEAPPLAATESELAKRGIAVVVFDPCGQRPADGDFLSVMRANASRLACATGASGCE